jgi:DNA replication protein DnaC
MLMSRSSGSFGKTFLAHAVGHIACRRGATLLAVRTEQLLKTLKQARLDRSYEAEFRKIISVDLWSSMILRLISSTEIRDLYDILFERDRAASIVVTSNRGPDQWLATFADPIRTQSALD